MKRWILKQHMEDNKDTMESLAEALGIVPNTLYKKMQGKVLEFTQSEIQAIAKRYNLSVDEVSNIFF